MSNAEINLDIEKNLKLPWLSTLLGTLKQRRSVADTRSMSDYLRRDIGLDPADMSIDRDIKMANANIRAGIIYPRPC